MRGTFFVDQGTVYRLYPVGEEMLAKSLAGVGTTYRSTETRVETTGKPRGFNGRIGRGQRAILHLDTGEGIVALRGVFREET